MKSWKTSLGAILAAIGMGLKHNPQTAAWSDVVQTIGIVLIGASARDNNVSSEEAGAKPKE
jgi:hypothetical protein